MKNKTTRNTKLQPKHRALANRHKIVPEIRLSGIWLIEAGFKTGERVSITIENRQLTIKPL